MSIYESAVKRPIMTSLCFFAVVILGVFSLLKLPIDLYPDIDTNTIMVITSYSGASASDIEQNVTRPLENTLNSVEHLKHITSQSKENVSIVTLEFEYGYNIDVLTNNVRDKLDMVSSSLPDEASTPIIFKFSTDMIPIMMLSAQAGQSMPALYKILDENVANPLARVDGVGTVSIIGAPKREIHVYVDPEKMEAYNLSIETISALVGAENRNIPGGTFDLGTKTYTLRVEGEFKDPKEMEDLVVGTHNGALVHLRDVARVDDSVEERAQEAYNNGQQGAMIIIQKQSGANSVDIANKVAAAMPHLQKSLPSDVKLGVIADTSDNIRQTITSLSDTIRDALIFVAIVVFVFLGKWRATMIILITIPLSLIGSFIYLYATGSSLNIISMSSLSIAVGMVVDDAIVVLENVTKHIERGSDPEQAAVHGTNEVALSVVASTLTLLAVFLPLTMVTGMTGVLFRELGWMVSIIMIVSIICALALTPMLCAKLLKRETTDSKLYTILYSPIKKGLDKFDVFYAKILDLAVHNRVKVLMGCVLFFVASLFLSKFIGTEFFPTNDNGRVQVKIELPNGTSTETSKTLAMQLYHRWTKEFPEMKICNFRVGQASTDNTFATLQDNGSHIITFNITLYNVADRPAHGGNKDLSTVCDLMRTDLKDYPDIKKSQVMLGGGNSGMGGQSTVDFEIYGYDFTETDSVAQQLKRTLLNIKGCGEVRISRSDYQPEYHVNFDREKLALHGLNLTTAATALRNRINGSTASYFREDGDEYDIKVMYAPENRRTIDDIENIMLYNAAGQGVRVKEVGDVVESSNPPTIERKDRERVNTVSAVIAGRAMGDVVNDAKKQIDKMEMPNGVTIQLSGSYEDQQDSFSDLATLGGLIIILVFVVMAAEFESLTYPFINMMTLTFALSGVLIGLLISGETLNVMSMIGAIMLIGIVVKNGIVLVDYINLNRERGMSVISAVVNGGKSRLRPVVMTTLTTILGMVPMAIGTGQGSEMWRPMGVAVIGGLTVSTILTLVFVPVVYCMFAGNGMAHQRRKEEKRRKKSELLNGK